MYSQHAFCCTAKVVGGIFCLPGWMELIALERGKVRTGAGPERFPLSHENSITVPTARLCRSLPPNQTVLMTHDPGTGPLGAGQRLASVILRPHHPPLYCLSLFPFTRSLTHTCTSHPQHSEPKGLTYIAATIRAMFWVIYCISLEESNRNFDVFSDALYLLPMFV